LDFFALITSANFVEVVVGERGIFFFELDWSLLKWNITRTRRIKQQMFGGEVPDSVEKFQK
jgi:hypothetical protein